MNKSIFMPIIGGIALGAFIFFTGPFLLIVLLLKFIFTPFGMVRMGRGFGAGPFYGNPQMRFAMADKIRNMSEEDYNSFNEKMNDRSGNCEKFYHQ